MTTPYQDIFDLFMQQVEDYRLIELYNGGTGSANLNQYLLGFMVLAIPEFDGCNQDLSSRNDTTMLFSFDMSDVNKKILSKIMVKQWLEKELNDISQMRWNITDADFKHYSEAQNTKSKQDLFTHLKEEVSQSLVDYQLKNNWNTWFSGNFI